MQSWKFAVATTALALCAQAEAAPVRIDFTLSGISALDQSDSNMSGEIAGFAGSSASGFVIVDISNGTVATGNTWTHVNSASGCPIYENGVCTYSYGDQAPVVTDWSFTSVLGTIRRPEGIYSAGGLQREYQPLFSPTGLPYWGASIGDGQQRQRLTSADGGVEWLSYGFNAYLQSSRSGVPGFDDLRDLLEPWHLGDGVWATLQVGYQEASWHEGQNDFVSRGNSQNFFITSMTVGPVPVSEPHPAALLGVALASLVALRRRAARAS